jgi:hypothetical protein
MKQDNSVQKKEPFELQPVVPGRLEDKLLYARRVLWWVIPPVAVIAIGLFFFWPMVLMLDTFSYTLATSPETVDIAVILLRLKDLTLQFLAYAKNLFSAGLMIAAVAFLYKAGSSFLQYRRRGTRELIFIIKGEYYLAVGLFYLAYGVLTFGLVNLERFIFR